MVKVQQQIASPQLDDFVAAIHHEIHRSGVKQQISPGAEIAITAGSRGVAHYPQIFAAIVDVVKEAGGHPFIIPSMGSHGGATPEGQIEVLHSLGITSETVGAPIRASMEVEQIGLLKNGNPVFVDRIANHADGIIVVGRVKPHTDFKGIIGHAMVRRDKSDPAPVLDMWDHIIHAPAALKDPRIKRGRYIASLYSDRGEVDEVVARTRRAVDAVAEALEREKIWRAA